VPPVSVPALRFVSSPVTVSVDPLLIVILPESVRFAAAVKFALLASVRLPVLAIVVSPASALVLVVEFSNCPVPFSVMLAASVTMFSPAAESVPPTTYVPPVSVLVVLL